jgi:uncharacterized membrane protein YeiB
VVVIESRGLQPVAPRERLARLDVQRGCAMFGVLVGNPHMRDRRAILT